MNLLTISGLTNFFTSIILGIFLFFNIKGKTLVRLWAYYAVGVSIWGLATIFISITPESQGRHAYLWWRVAYVGLIYLPTLYYHFVCEFIKINRNTLLKIFYSITTIFFALNLISRKLFIGQINYEFEQFYWTTGPSVFLWTYIIVFVFGVVTLSHVELMKGYFGIKDRKKRIHLLYFALGGIVGWIGGWTCYLENLDLGWYPVGNFGINLYPLLLGYAIYKHQLMDIEIIVKKTLVFAGLFLVSYAVFAGFAYVGSTYFEKIVYNRWLAMVPSVLIIVLILRPLENYLRNITDKYLFQKKYDYRQLLRTFTDEVLTVLGKMDLVTTTVYKLSEIIKLTSAEIYLFDEDEQKYILEATTKKIRDKKTFNVNSPFILFMKETGKYLHYESMSTPEKNGHTLIGYPEDLKSALIIPLKHSKELIGFLSLGKKKSDEDFTQDDIDILLPLARTLSISLTNAQLFVKLSEAQAQAAQREKMAVIGTLSAGINHEICNPLGIARGQCEMFLLNYDEGVYKDQGQQDIIDKAREIMNKVIHETDRATIITRKLSSFAKPAKGELMRDVDVQKEIDEVISLLEHDLKLDNVRIIKNSEGNLPFIEADRKQLQEVFFNIIRNAAQAIHKNGKITINIKYINHKVQIDISDTGPGMEKGVQERIFDPFFTTKEPGKGTGLGLFLVKQIVERNGGKIYATSEAGKGTTFTLLFNTVETGKKIGV